MSREEEIVRNEDKKDDERKDYVWCFVIGKLVQFNSKKYGVCSLLYEKKLTGDDMTAQPNDDASDDYLLFKRPFTLPTVNLTRCTLFSCVLALDFVKSHAVKSLLKNDDDDDCDSSPTNIVLVLKHKPTFDIITDPKICSLVGDGSSSSSSTSTPNWPPHLRQNCKMIKRVISGIRRMRLNVTYVPPSKNLDGDLELITNCDRDPMSEENKVEPENKEAFDRMMNVARQHKQSALEVLNIGGFSFDKPKRKLSKKECKFDNLKNHDHDRKTASVSSKDPARRTTTTTTNSRNIPRNKLPKKSGKGKPRQQQQQTQTPDRRTCGSEINGKPDYNEQTEKQAREVCENVLSGDNDVYCKFDRLKREMLGGDGEESFKKHDDQERGGPGITWGHSDHFGGMLEMAINKCEEENTSVYEITGANTTESAYESFGPSKYAELFFDDVRRALHPRQQQRELCDITDLDDLALSFAR